MNPVVQDNLGLILLLPWYAILLALYWRYPRTPRNAARRRFDVGAIVLALAATSASLHWSHAHASTAHGQMWPQVLATSVSYGVFLAVLTAAWFLRRRVFAG